jgi:Methyltransferase domain
MDATKRDDMTPESLILHVDESIEKALRGESKLDMETLAIKGFSTPTMRHFFNNLCSADGTVYLEVGAWFGASACAAMCGNAELSSFVVEDYSQDFSETGVRESLRSSLCAALQKSGRLTFIEKPCYEIQRRLIDEVVSIFFFDGEHSRPSQARALPYFFERMAETFLFIVDDTNWEPVQLGTEDGFAALSGKLKIEREWKLRTDKPDDPIFHNGLDIYLISKT